jgi:hypothetical protein
LSTVPKSPRAGASRSHISFGSANLSCRARSWACSSQYAHRPSEDRAATKRKSAGCSQRSCPHLTASPSIGLISFAGATPNFRSQLFQSYDCAALAAESVASGLTLRFYRGRLWRQFCNLTVMFQPAEDVARCTRRICNCESLADQGKVVERWWGRGCGLV